MPRSKEQFTISQLRDAAGINSQGITPNPDLHVRVFRRFFCRRPNHLFLFFLMNCRRYRRSPLCMEPFARSRVILPRNIRLVGNVFFSDGIHAIPGGTKSRISGWLGILQILHLVSKLQCIPQAFPLRIPKRAGLTPWMGWSATVTLLPPVYFG